MSEFDHKQFLQNLTSGPGVYQMLDKRQRVLYVGKARDLKKRLASYFRSNLTDVKTSAMMRQVCDIHVTLTQTENEALLLENNLIKKIHPPFNILLRDDKSYPYIFVSAHPLFPRIDIHRGPQKEKGQYFGPYPSAHAVHETLDWLQKIFKIRQCSDNFFQSRTRPCLQYQIKRCTAPCVGYVDSEAYNQNVRLAILFLQGKNKKILDELAKKMEKASLDLNFEEAARFRDQIISLRRIQERQYVSTQEGDIDVVALVCESGVICIQVIFIRDGRLIGNRSYFPTIPLMTELSEGLSAFLTQFYLSPNRGESLPKKIIVNLDLPDRQWIQDALSEQLGYRLTISDSLRGQFRQWVQMATMNAKQSLMSYLADKMHFHQRLEALQKALKLLALPQRLECFDISHTLGEATVASCVVFDVNGPLKAAYRRFNIQLETGGDDYAAMQQALTRHYLRLKSNEGEIPAILVIDGGKGQLAVAEKVLEELQVSDVVIIAISKGVTRKSGWETLYLSGHSVPFELAADSPGFHLLQQIRDEAHRFAITGHRSKRAKARKTSTLEEIPGIGAARRRELLKFFGGLQEIKLATVDEIAKVKGVSRELAQRIYDALRS